MSETGTKCGWTAPSQREVEAYHPRARALSPAGAFLLWHGIHAPQAQEIYAKLPVRLRQVSACGVELPPGSVFHTRILKGRWVGYCDWRAKCYALEWSPVTFVHEHVHLAQVYNVTAEQAKVFMAGWKAHRSDFPEKGKASWTEGLAEASAYLYVRGAGALASPVVELIRAVWET
jgi:hypothetical protein